MGNIQRIIMNALTFIILSLTAIATATPYGGRCGRSPGGCKSKSRGSSSLKTIAGTAADTPALSTLLTAVKAAGLAPTLSGKGDFTVFAPTNDAFDKLGGKVSLLLQPMNKDMLSAILVRRFANQNHGRRYPKRNNEGKNCWR